MDTSIWKPIAFGVLFGALAYFLPFFLLKGILFLMAIGAIFRFFAWRRYRAHAFSGQIHMVFADGIRKMSDEEYAEFKTRFLNSDYGRGYGCGGHRWKKEKEKENN